MLAFWPVVQFFWRQSSAAFWNFMFVQTHCVFL